MSELHKCQCCGQTLPEPKKVIEKGKGSWLARFWEQKNIRTKTRRVYVILRLRYNPKVSVYLMARISAGNLIIHKKDNMDLRDYVNTHAVLHYRSELVHLPDNKHYLPLVRKYSKLINSAIKRWKLN